MKYRVDFTTNNLCRVFELPQRFSSDFCFSGPIQTMFKLVDWFNPVSPLEDIEEIDGDTLQGILTSWLLKKPYIHDKCEYLVLCEFGLAFVIRRAVAESEVRE